MARAQALRLLRAAFVSAIVGVTLAGCGGGSGSSSSGLLGGGQDPDPAVQDFPVAYVKRPLLLDDDGALLTFDVRDPTAFMPGAELFVRDRASASAVERNITAGVFPNDAMGNPPLYDVKDLSSSFDGEQARLRDARA